MKKLPQPRTLRAAAVVVAVVGVIATTQAAASAPSEVQVVRAVPMMATTTQPVPMRSISPAVSRGYFRGRACPDGLCEQLPPSPTVRASHPDVMAVARRHIQRTLQAAHPTEVRSTTLVGSGGGGDCAPSVALPQFVVVIVHKYLGGCDAAALLWIIYHESGGRVTAQNPSGAYGLGQALPASKMAPFGSDYLTNPDVQVRWMIAYVRASYGGPQNAYWFWTAHNWY